jgi:hypothetical protein
MRDLLLQASGVLGFAGAAIHGVLGEVRVFPHVNLPTERARFLFLLRVVWQASTVGWMALAVLLAVAPSLGSDAARHWIVAMAVVNFGFAAIGNAWANRFRHFGWVLLAVVVALALAGW